MEWWEAPEYESPEERAAVRERARLIAWAIASLSSKQRKLLVLRYVHDLSFVAIGAQFEVSGAAAFKMHARVLRILATRLQERRIHGMEEI